MCRAALRQELLEDTCCGADPGTDRLGVVLRCAALCCVHGDAVCYAAVFSTELRSGAVVQIQGKDRLAVAEAGKQLGLDGTYIARSYIEQVSSSSTLSTSYKSIKSPVMLW